MQRVRERERLDLGDDVLDDLPSVGGGREIAIRPLEAGPRRRLHAAVAAWTFGVWLLCYVALPAALAASGIYPGLIDGLVGETVGVLATLCLLIGALEAFRPKIDLRRRGEPVVAAAAGILVTWALLHNAGWPLRPFSEMPPQELIALIGVNVVEASLFGAMLATFVRSRIGAFAVGAAFELTLLGLATASWIRLGL